jgi:hypothetical protein
LRKRLKKKLRSCPSCKPHKTHGAPRWKNKDLYELKLAEDEILETKKKTPTEVLEETDFGIPTKYDKVSGIIIQ